MARVIDKCPYWLQGKLREMLGDQLMKGLHGTKDDELRRVREALEWLDLPLKREQQD